MIKVKDMEEFFKAEGSSKLLYVITDNCETSQMMRPSVEAAARSVGIPLFEIDGMSNRKYMSRLGVQTVPTILLYNGNSLAKIMRGFITEANLKEELKTLN